MKNETGLTKAELAIANVEAGQRVRVNLPAHRRSASGSLVQTALGEVVEVFPKNGDLWLIVNLDNGRVVESFIGDVVEVVS